jgi:GNAT superfamily N-acetyltransferase
MISARFEGGNPEMEFRELVTDREVAEAFPLMATLRDRIREDSFLAEVRRQQIEGYRLCGAFDGGRLVSLAGVRRTHTLARGEHVFVDDLVTAQADRGKGWGRALIAWLARRAAAEGIARIHLDSRLTAKGFYETVGFTFGTSIPCSVAVDDPAHRLPEETAVG